MDFSNSETNQELAAFLKQERLLQKRELEEIADVTGIPFQHLKNIEKGEFGSFDTFYLKMYLKKYAETLSMSLDDLYVRFYGEVLNREPEAAIKRPVAPRQHLDRSRSGKLGKILMAACALLLLGGAAWVITDMVRNLGGDEGAGEIQIQHAEEPDSPEPEEPAPDETPEEAEEPVVPEEEVPTTRIEPLDHELDGQAFDVITTGDEILIEFDFSGSIWMGMREGAVEFTDGTGLNTAGRTFAAGDHAAISVTETAGAGLQFNIVVISAVEVRINGESIAFESSASRQDLLLNLIFE